jgi:hypothetical protein
MYINIYKELERTKHYAGSDLIVHAYLCKGNRTFPRTHIHFVSNVLYIYESYLVHIL